MNVSTLLIRSVYSSEFSSSIATDDGGRENYDVHDSQAYDEINASDTTNAIIRENETLSTSLSSESSPSHTFGKNQLLGITGLITDIHAPLSALRTLASLLLSQFKGLPEEQTKIDLVRGMMEESDRIKYLSNKMIHTLHNYNAAKNSNERLVKIPNSTPDISQSSNLKSMISHSKSKRKALGDSREEAREIDVNRPSSEQVRSRNDLNTSVSTTTSNTTNDNSNELSTRRRNIVNEKHVRPNTIPPNSSSSSALLIKRPVPLLTSTESKFCRLSDILDPLLHEAVSIDVLPTGRLQIIETWYGEKDNAIVSGEPSRLRRALGGIVDSVLAFLSTSPSNSCNTRNEYDLGDNLEGATMHVDIYCEDFMKGEYKMEKSGGGILIKMRFMNNNDTNLESEETDVIVYQQEKDVGQSNSNVCKDDIDDVDDQAFSLADFELQMYTEQIQSLGGSVKRVRKGIDILLN